MVLPWAISQINMSARKMRAWGLGLTTSGGL